MKLSFVLRRLPTLSRAEFQSYWRETHAALVAQHAQALRIKRYVQTHTLNHPANEALRSGRGGPAEYDGVAELWWESIEAFAEAAGTAEGIAAGKALLEDERRFIDLEHSPIWLSEEHEVLG